MPVRHAISVLLIVALGWCLPVGAALAQTDPGVWITRAPLPTPRQEMPHVALGGKVYVLGGIDGGRRGSAVVEAYDPATNTWATAAPLPIPMHHLGAAAVDGTLYVLGGYLGNTFSPSRRVFAYDPAADAWTEKTPAPTARGAHVAVAVAGKIHVIGGTSSGAALATHEVYDPAADTWATAAPMPTASEHLAAARIDSLIYVVGGRIFEDFQLTNLRDLQVYSPTTDAWRRLAPMPTARGGLAAAGLHGRLYVFGGEIPGVFPENEAYDPATDTWRSMASMPTPRHGIGAAVVADTVFIIGGGPVEGFGVTGENTGYVPPAPVSTALDEDLPLPGGFALFQNYPNPFRSAATLRFALPRAAEVTLTVFDALGRAVATPAQGRYPPGTHEVVWQARGLPSGLYLYRIETAGFAETKRLLLLK